MDKIIRLLTVDEVASQLQLGRSAIYKLFREGRLRSVKIGRSRRVPDAFLRSFLEEITEKGAA